MKIDLTALTENELAERLSEATSNAILLAHSLRSRQEENETPAEEKALRQADYNSVMAVAEAIDAEMKRRPPVSISEPMSAEIAAEKPEQGESAPDLTPEQIRYNIQHSEGRAAWLELDSKMRGRAEKFTPERVAAIDGEITAERAKAAQMRKSFEGK